MSHRYKSLQVMLNATCRNCGVPIRRLTKATVPKPVWGHIDPDPERFGLLLQCLDSDGLVTDLFADPSPAQTD